MNNLKKVTACILSVLLYIRFLSAQETQIVYLSGTGSDNTVDWEFYCTGGMNSGKWTTIPVPSCWELQGFGAYNYGYDKTDGRADEKGLYKHNFDVPENWKGKKVNIVFEGAMTDTEVKINGKQAGPVHHGAFYRFKYDISRLLNFGSDNLLEVKVSKVSSNESVNKAERNADYWVFGGIYRPVYLEILPENHISRVAVDAKADGNLIANVHWSGGEKKVEVKVEVEALDGKKLSPVYEAPLKKDGFFSISKKYEAIDLWSPEFPNLYSLIVSLTHKGKILHQVKQNVGFRTIGVRERDGVYLNGVKIKFKGVNRHSFYPSSGRTLNNKLILEDALLIKEMNMNAVRNSHYPADPYFYKVCDSLGIMVLDELGGWHDAYDTEVGSQLVEEMINKSMNHASVVMWVNGNEGGHNRELLPLYSQLDIQKRHVVQAWENFRGMDTQHYRDYDYGVGSHYQGHNIVMPTEFLHGMYDGGHGSGLEDFWKRMWDNPLSAGGFLWDFADEAIVRTDKNGELDSDGNHGADGIIGPYHEKEGSFFTIKEVWSPIFFEHKEITEAFDGKFRVENRFHFTNLNQCTFKWEAAKFPRPKEKGEIVKISGEAYSENINPLEKGNVVLEDFENFKLYDILYLTAYNPQGMEIFTWSWPIRLPKDLAIRLVEKKGNEHPIEVSESDADLTVEANGIAVCFSKTTGLLQGVLNTKGKISLSNGPVLCEGESEFTELTYKKETDSVIVEAHFTDKSVFKVLKWTVYPSGWVKLNLTYSPTVERHDLMGINFSYPEDKITGFQWMGRGPYRVWKNRMKGNRLGVWDKKYNNTITGQTEYIYPEFKGFHSNMYWLKVKTREQDFIVVSPDRDLFFRMYTPGSPKDPYNTAPKFPDGDISFLQGITPMGTKSLQTFRMGPMSDQNIYYAYGGIRPKHMILYFDFGLGE